MNNPMGFGPIKVPRLTKNTAELAIAHHLGVAPPQLSFTFLKEKPRLWRHACVPTGVVALTPVSLPYFTEGFIDYAVCRSCGKVIYTFESDLSAAPYHR